MWKQATQLAGVELDCTDDELTKITKTADEYHVKFHEMDDN